MSVMVYTLRGGLRMSWHGLCGNVCSSCLPKNKLSSPLLFGMSQSSLHKSLFGSGISRTYRTVKGQFLFYISRTYDTLVTLSMNKVNSTLPTFRMKMHTTKPIKQERKNKNSSFFQSSPSIYLTLHSPQCRMHTSFWFCIQKFYLELYVVFLMNSAFEL